MLVLPDTSILVIATDAALQREVSRVLRAAGARVRPCLPGAALVALVEVRPAIVLLAAGGDPSAAWDPCETARRLNASPRGAVVYLSADPSASALERAAATAPHGYLIYPCAPAQLVATLRVALARRRAESEDAARRERCLWEGLQRISSIVAETEQAARARDLAATVHLQEHAGPPGSLSELSNREWAVLRGLLANGRVPGIARTLCISPHTVRNHLKAIYRKLGVSSQTDLIERMQGHLPGPAPDQPPSIQ